MRAREFLTEIDRRGFLKGLASLAAGSAVPTAKAGTYQSWDKWKGKELDLWQKRFENLSPRVNKVFNKMLSVLTPEQKEKIGNVQIEVLDSEGKKGYFRQSKRLIGIDLTVYWDLSDDSIGCVIGHELGHAYYGITPYYKNTPEQNRRSELQADVFGVLLAKKAGYDLSKFFSDMSAKEKQEGRADDDTHPTYRERVNHIRKETGLTVSHIMRGIEVINSPVMMAKLGFENQPEVAESQIEEKWSEKYKRSINCNNPKGFSQRAHCQGRKK